ncbi:MAG: cytidine deaminase [Flavobacteriaceae bacterium]|nr:cytidine deaminase [Flavobacteriaceae bacterium]
MITKNISFEVQEYNDIEELNIEDRKLMDLAVLATKQAYAPYSEFKVGAALLLDNGEIIVGANQENAAYPSGMCAERVAIWTAGVKYPEAKITKLCISASSLKNPVDQPLAPCGACRQTLSEYEIKQNKNMEILLMGETGKVLKTNSLLNLLPLAFDKEFL